MQTTYQNQNKEIKVVHHLTEEHQEDLHALYQNEWWTNDRTKNDIKTILKNSSIIFGIVETSTNRLIAFTRVLTDYFKVAHVYDVIVHPEYRQIKLGKKLLNFVLDHPDIKSLKNVELVCKKEMVSFYEQFGFSADYANSVPMRKQKNEYHT